MELYISNSGQEPIYAQITRQIKAKILNGELQQGDALPSIRLLAKELRISVITTKRAYEELEKEGFSPKVTTYNFCTNGSHYAGEAGIRTIGMGPARENLAHTIDEYAEVEDLTNVSVCYVGVMKALLG